MRGMLRMFDKEDVIGWIICIIFTIGFALIGWYLPADSISDNELETEKQHLYEVMNETPKDVEQAIGTENLQITCEENITYKFSGKQCSLTVVYDTDYNVVEETFSDQRSNDVIRFLIAFLFGLLGLILGLLAALAWFAVYERYEINEYKRLRRKRERQRKKQEKAKKKEAKRKAKNPDVKVIQQ